MSLFFGNDMDLVSEILTDGNGDAVVAGTIEAEILTEDGGTSLLAKAAMIHSAAGVWKRRIQAEDVNALGAVGTTVLIQITIGDPPDATFALIDQVRTRLS